MATPTPPDDSTTRNALREAFEALLDLPPEARAGWLDAHVADAGLRERLQHLLAAHEGLGFLDTTAGEHAARLSPRDLAPEGLIGSRIGAFRLVRALGRGGMSAVFLGEREDADFRQQAAVKLLRRGLYSELEQRLFQRERRVLAALEHPHIARLIDGGVTTAGIPYLIMEYVDGVPITRYAAVQNLDARARVRLFSVVCRAVAEAHRNLIVHRDIKPSNILVAADGTVKLLDFGIAKLIEEDDAGTAGTIGVFTPEYAAPEQVRGEMITTATDVYGLGVLLHELLLGIRPSGKPTRRPSSSVDAAGAATIPRVERARLRKILRGDLDNILLKALAEEPQRRYASAGSLADDIDNYLGGRAVAAHPPSRAYRARKFVQRHRGGVAVTALFVLGILAALGVALWQANVARREAQLADATRDFMIDLFQTASEDLPRDQRPTPQQLVETAAKRARDDSDLAAPVRAQLLSTLGKVALANGEYTQAETLLDDAIQRARELDMSETSPEWIDLLVQKGNLLHRTNRNNQADALMRSIQSLLLRQDSEPAVSGLMLLGATRVYAGDNDEAVAIAEQAARKAERVFGADSVNGIETLTYLGQLCEQAGRYRESAALLEPAVARWRKLNLPQDEDFARTLLHLAAAEDHLGARITAEPLYREAIALMRRVFDTPHDRLATALGGYALFLLRQDRFDEAQTALSEALAIDRRVVGADDARTAVLLDSQALLEHARHHDDAAETAASQAIGVFAVHATEAGYLPEFALTRLHDAAILAALGHLDTASAQLDAAQLSQRFGAISAEVADGAHVAARIALARGNATDALAACERGLAITAKLDPPAPAVAIALLRVRADALTALGQRDQALTAVAKALALVQSTNPAAHAQYTSLLAQRARLELAQGNTGAAAADIASARALGVPAADLSREDAATLSAQ